MVGNFVYFTALSMRCSFSAQVGCGNSTLSHDMVLEGFTQIVNIGALFSSCHFLFWSVLLFHSSAQILATLSFAK